MFSHVPWEYRYKGERGNGTKQEFWFLVVLLLAFQKTRAVPVGLIPLLRYAVHYWLAYGYHVWGGPWFFVLSTVLLCVNTNSSLLVLIVVYGRWTRSRSDRFMAYQRVNYIYIYGVQVLPGCRLLPNARLFGRDIWLVAYIQQHMFWYCECKAMCLKVLVAWKQHLQYIYLYTIAYENASQEYKHLSPSPVSLLLECRSANVQEKDNSGRNVLHWACLCGDVKLVGF